MLYDILLKIGSVAFMVIFFGLCIFIHELGHFLAARWRGLYIGAFSIGFRKIWWKKIGGVEYRIGCIPVGGYVELPQVDASGEAKDAEGNILPKVKPLDKIIVAFAGPFFNMIFGLLLGVVIWIHGIPQDSPVLQEFKVTQLKQESPEYKAGLRNGDVIVKLNGETFSSTWNGFVRKILFTIGDVTLTVKRQNKTLEITYKPQVNKSINPEDEIAYPFFFPEIPIYLYPRSGSAAEKAGIRAGDRLLGINGKTPDRTRDLEELFLFESQNKVDLRVSRKGKILEFKQITPEPEKKNGEEGIYLLGFSGNPVEKVLKNLPMEKAGLRKGDTILSVNGRKVSNVTEIRDAVNALKGKETSVVISRNGKERTLKVTPRYLRYNTLGLSYAGISHPTPFRQFANVMTLTWNSLRGIVYGLGNTLHVTEKHTTIRAKHMSGPIGIGKYLFLSVYQGSLILGLNVVVVITFNLGLVNLLPIPVLDGGHILLALLQMIFRRPVSPKILEPITIAFITLLIAFMVFVSFYDVKKIVAPFLRKSASQTQTEKKIEKAPVKEKASKHVLPAEK